MKQLFSGMALAILFTAGWGGTAFATVSAELELVSGTSTLFVLDNGSIACTGPACAVLGFSAFGDANPVQGVVVAGASDFNGWNISVTTGGSNSPNCNGVNVVGCIGDTAITASSAAGASDLGVFFADTGFVSSSAYVVTFSTPLQTPNGSVATQTAYNFSGPLPLGNGVLSPLPGSGQIGSPLVSNFPGVTAITTSGSGGGTDLELATILKSSPTGPSNFQIQGNISAVPEPAAVTLLGTVLALCASGLRRRKSLS